MLLYRLLLFYKKFYNDLEEINTIKRYAIDSITISHTIYDYIPLITNIELKANHDYFLLGYFDNKEGIDKQTIASFALPGYKIAIDYFEYISICPMGTLYNGTGAFSIYIIKPIKDVKVSFRMWNYVNNQDYTVNAQVCVLTLK